MYKFVIVTDSDRASGFRLAGAEVFEAQSAEEARTVIPPCSTRTISASWRSTRSTCSLLTRN